MRFMQEIKDAAAEGHAIRTALTDEHDTKTCVCQGCIRLRRDRSDQAGLMERMHLKVWHLLAAAVFLVAIMFSAVSAQMNKPEATPCEREAAQLTREYPQSQADIYKTCVQLGGNR